MCFIIIIIFFLYRFVTKKVLKSVLQNNITDYFGTNTTTSLQQDRYMYIHFLLQMCYKEDFEFTLTK